ncbi:MAG: aminodeoxychorismate synthase component I [Gammaproteobacteria bacterium]|nr:aminodeoxychorismate synthase component I [Gammaproteobacteria bacterium]
MSTTPKKPKQGSDCSQNQAVFTRSVDLDGLEKLKNIDGLNGLQEEGKLSYFDLTLLHELNPVRYPFLLESVAKGGLGSFDILFAYPQETLQLNDSSDKTSFLEQVTETFEGNRVAKADVLNAHGTALPFTGGWYAYFSYDYAQVVEPTLILPKSEFPLAVMTRIPAAVMIDHKNSALTLMAESGFEGCLDEMQADIQQVVKLQVKQQQAKKQQSSSPFHSSVPNTKAVYYEQATEEPEQKYLTGVDAIKEYILSGDVFQVNLSRQWQVTLEKSTDYLDVYRALRKSNPAPFAALAIMQDAQGAAWQVISSSPERLVKYQSPWVETRPIAGTRKRGPSLEADKALIEELISHPKERAEHIMLIDLERNDLGRICQPGTVEVNELMAIESYEHVHHIVSNVRGKLQDGLSPLDIIHALFPGGTITGCPKIRCMEIVAELEQMPREAYTGSLGYINRDGSLDLNILIRTMVQSERAGVPTVQFRAGAGIVADSEAQSELTETRHKAKGLVNALTAKPVTTASGN